MYSWKMRLLWVQIGVVAAVGASRCAPDPVRVESDGFEVVDDPGSDLVATDGKGQDTSAVDGDASLATDGTPNDGGGLEDSGGNDVSEWDVVFSVIAATEPISSGHFATSGVCEPCHSASETSSAMRDPAGRNVSPYDLWQSSMKANSARDPFWRATVSAEIERFPDAVVQIEEKCTWCHIPMAAYHAKTNALPPPKLADIGSDTALGQLAADGVSCTLCHRITSEGLGTAESFTGGFHLTEGKTVFGQHGDLHTTPMINQSGFTPQQASHIRSSALCGTCHTVITYPLGGDENVPKKPFFEQATYLEWRNSEYSTEVQDPGPNATDCFGCHLPETDEDGSEIVTKVARRPDGGDFPPLRDRDQFGRHLFVGGNTLIVAMIRDHSEKLNSGVPKEAFDATIAAARKQLSEHTASLEWLNVEFSDDMLILDVKITNRTGHRLPTGYPSRRVFLRLDVLSPAGELWMSSGRTDQNGRILGKSGKPLPSELLGGPALPHADMITDVDIPPVWETVVGDSDGKMTFSLLDAATFLKDNRILPHGWDENHPDAENMGSAAVDGDDDFGAGQDVVHYRLPLEFPLPKGTVIRTTAFYQVVKPRYVDELREIVTPETAAFGAAWDKADRAPEPLAVLTYVVQ